VYTLLSIIPFATEDIVFVNPRNVFTVVWLLFGNHRISVYLSHFSEKRCIFAEKALKTDKNTTENKQKKR